MPGVAGSRLTSSVEEHRLRRLLRDKFSCDNLKGQQVCYRDECGTMTVIQVAAHADQAPLTGIILMPDLTA